MQGKRTGIDFSKHELHITEQDNLLIHHLKKPDTFWDNIKFINTNGVMVVTGDYGNWIFCREFHPSPENGVSDCYWCEKLKNSSTQECYEFDEDSTKETIDELLKEDDLSEEEIEYLEGCLDALCNGEFDYTYFAYRENIGRFEDGESVPCDKKIKSWLLTIFDGFDEICRRLAEKENNYANRIYRRNFRWKNKNFPTICKTLHKSFWRLCSHERRIS
jgi:hypothetical protein